jgi:hypothetical protein
LVLRIAGLGLLVRISGVYRVAGTWQGSSLQVVRGQTLSSLWPPKQDSSLCTFLLCSEHEGDISCSNFRSWSADGFPVYSDKSRSITPVLRVGFVSLLHSISFSALCCSLGMISAPDSVSLTLSSLRLPHFFLTVYVQESTICLNQSVHIEQLSSGCLVWGLPGYCQHLVLQASRLSHFVGSLTGSAGARETHEIPPGRNHRENQNLRPLSSSS